MHVVGVICEFNPFHNGHVYFLNKVKELYPDSLIILVMSTCFTMRGELSILNKWDKTSLALDNNVDLVIELPHYYATNSADIFSEGSLKILSLLKCDTLVFGSESNDIESIKELANIQLNNNEYNKYVKEYMDNGYNYPTSMSKALEKVSNKTINSPNDLLGLSYVKEIIKNNYNINPVTIQRTNDYHEKIAKNTITSATSIRELINTNKDITNYVPKETKDNIITNYQDKFYTILKYKLLIENDLTKYIDVSEGIDQRIKKYLQESNNYEELINNIKTKRYTYNRLNRMFIHILTNTYKDDLDIKKINYIKVLGFTKKGQKYIKQDFNVPIITNYSQLDDKTLNYQRDITFLYNEIINQSDLNIKELKSIPIIK